MARLVTTRCPRCGADVPLEDGARSAVCKYCNTLATLDGPRSVRGGAARSGSGCGPASFAVLAVVGVVVLGAVGVGVMAMSSGGGDASTSSVTAVTVPAPSVAPVPAPLPVAQPVMPDPPVSPVTNVVEGPPLLALDTDGDGHPELLAPGTRGEGTLYAIYDARTGAEKAHTPVIEGLNDSLVAAVGQRLVVAAENGQLTGYDVVSGDSQWSTALGERVARLCEPRTAGTLHVETTDGRKLSVDLVTGRQTDTREACATLVAQNEFQADMRDRRDYAAPRGVESYRCGHVRVMGSQNFEVQDQCEARGHVDDDALDGMSGSRIWRSGRGWLVFGVRQPGTAVPMVGRIERGSTLAWKSEVPASNPLDAQPGSPGAVALVGDAILAAYDSGHGWSLTCFAVADGARRWTTQLGEARVDALVALDDAVAVSGGAQVRVISVADGTTRATLGG